VAHPDQPRLLRAYIADHLQLMRSGHELALRVAGRERDPRITRLMERAAAELRRQQALAVAFLRQLGASPPRLRLVLGVLAERAGRLKPNGRLLRASPLAPVFELEVLEAVLQSSARFWRVVEAAEVADDALVAGAARAAEELLEPIEELRRELGARALRPAGA
jgi:hypothetical protein